MSESQKLVIVVEDEWLIRIGATEELRSRGFNVLEATNADEALEHLNLRHQQIAVLFTDVHMPGDMTGFELAHHVHNHWPWIAILVASGNARPTQGSLPAGSRFLVKPYETECMAAHVRELANA